MTSQKNKANRLVVANSGSGRQFAATSENGSQQLQSTRATNVRKRFPAEGKQNLSKTFRMVWNSTLKATQLVYLGSI